MGTSTARRGPTGRLWRLAKGAATRYLAPEAAAPMSASEVAARYAAALGEGQPPEAGALSAFRLTRKTAQNLGDFVRTALTQGVPQAFQACGLAELAGQSPEVAAQGLASAWLKEGGGLEDAVARSALLSILPQALETLAKTHQSPGSRDPGPAKLVRDFLAASLYRRLLFDLGESLEAAAPGLSALDRGFSGIRATIMQAAEEPGETAPVPENWRGLAGWQQATRMLTDLLNRLLAKHQGPGS